MDKIYVTEKGRLLLVGKRDELVAELRASQFDKGKAAAGDSNSWHDNAEFEMHATKEMMLAKQVSEIMQQLEHAILVESPVSDHTLSIGHVAVLHSEEGGLVEYVVAGFGETDLRATPKRLSYDSPMLREFFGKSIDAAAHVLVKGEPKKFTLKEIK